MVIPGSTKDMIQNLQKEYSYSIRAIAKIIDVDPKILYEIWKGKSSSARTRSKLMVLYIQISLINQFRNEKYIDNDELDKQVPILEENCCQFLRLKRHFNIIEYSSTIER